MTMSIPFGACVRAWRESRSLKQRDLATASGIAPERLCRIEKGRRQAMVEEAGRLALALGITLSELASLPPREEHAKTEAA